MAGTCQEYSFSFLPVVKSNTMYPSVFTELLINLLKFLLFHWKLKLTFLRLRDIKNEVELVLTVTQSHTGLHDRPIENSTHERAKLSSPFSAFRKCLKWQNWYHYVLCCLKNITGNVFLNFILWTFMECLHLVQHGVWKCMCFAKSGKILFFKTTHYK